MKFDELDRRMREFEKAHDHAVPPSVWMIARLDGRSFSRLIREQAFTAPSDTRLRDLMIVTLEHSMTCGFTVLYGYTGGDEISLLLHPEEQAFGRKIRKFISVLAGEASAACTLQLGRVACFDCRISELPSVQLVVDYFRWRNQATYRNALHAQCYWRLREDGQSAHATTTALAGLSAAQKKELLLSRGISFNKLPGWQQCGAGLYWEQYRKQVVDSETGESLEVVRRRIRRELELPIKSEYDAFIRSLIAAATQPQSPTDERT